MNKLFICYKIFRTTQEFMHFHKSNPIGLHTKVNGAPKPKVQN